jgi:hypothetical protein
VNDSTDVQRIRVIYADGDELDADRHPSPPDDKADYFVIPKTGTVVGIAVIGQVNCRIMLGDFPVDP